MCTEWIEFRFQINSFRLDFHFEICITIVCIMLVAANMSTRNITPQKRNVNYFSSQSQQTKGCCKRYGPRIRNNKARHDFTNWIQFGDVQSLFVNIDRFMNDGHGKRTIRHFGIYHVIRTYSEKIRITEIPKPQDNVMYGMEANGM